jgi:hypothetical protein
MADRAPLTPPDCDLQDFPFMPLHVARLRDSDLAAEESPEACWYAVLLWAASWHQIPAASLPDNDAVLAKLIGLGRDVRTFRKHKAAAMRGFVLCDDGRLYHPVVAEQAVTAWESKLQQRWRTECARIKKANQRTGANDPLPTFEEFLSKGTSHPRPEHVPGDIDVCPQGHRIQETGTGTGIIDSPPSPLGGERSKSFEEAWTAWHADGVANRGPDEAWAAWPEAAIRAGGETALLSAVRSHLARLSAAPRQTRKAFHRWLRDGAFEAYQAAAPASVAQRPWEGPTDVWALVVEANGEPFARSWLAGCGWSDVPKAIIGGAYTITRLREAVGAVLADHGIELMERAA